jgi:hypothetical protein
VAGLLWLVLFLAIRPRSRFRLREPLETP